MLDNSSSSLIYHWFLLVTFLRCYISTPTFEGQLDPAIPNLCVKTERCMCHNEFVNCMRVDKMPKIPDSIGNRKKLYISFGKFTYYKITRKNLTNLQHLESLKLTDCKLRSIESNAFLDMRNLKRLILNRNELPRIIIGTFSGMSRLKELDLSFNRIRTIDAFTFSDLNLNKLILSSNHHMKIQSTSFYKLSTIELALNNIYLKVLDYKAFSIIKRLSKLKLVGNNISAINPLFKTLLQNNITTLDLDGNPIVCDCTIEWLRKLKIGGVNIICASPESVKGRNLKTLISTDTVCAAPRITSVSIDLRLPNEAMLTCSAKGTMVPILQWTVPFVSNVQTSLLGKPNQTMNNKGEWIQSSQLRYNATLKTDAQKYTCVAWLNGGSQSIESSDTVVISLRGPPPPLKTPLESGTILTPSVKNPQDEITNNNNLDITTTQKPKGMLLKVQFTLLDMIIAVITTFTVSLGLLVLLSYCMVIRKRKNKDGDTTRRWDTLGSKYSATESHEYDVPRMEQPLPSTPAAMYRPMNGMEFVDFKTQKKISSFH